MKNVNTSGIYSLASNNVTENIHGTLRQFFLAPLVGDLSARRFSVFTGMILIFLITWFCLRWIKPVNKKSLLAVGFVWVILTILFEVILGVYLFGYSRERIFEDYDILHGGLMGLGLLFMFFVPLFVWRIQSQNDSEDIAVKYTK